MKTSAPRVALIHALGHSPAPVNAAFERDWPQCVRMNLLDDSLAADLARTGTSGQRRATASMQGPKAEQVNRRPCAPQPIA